MLSKPFLAEGEDKGKLPPGFSFLGIGQIAEFYYTMLLYALPIILLL